MALLYAAETEAAALLQVLKQNEPGLDIRVWPECGGDTDIEFAVVAGEAPADLRRFSNLRAVQSTWAGVNALLASPLVPPHVPIARMVAPEMTAWMSEYVTFHVLDSARRGAELRRHQTQRHWHSSLPARKKPVIGILGVGELGGDVAVRLAGLGFDVCGYARSRHDLANITLFVGPESLQEFLGRSRILVCLLPLTDATRGILNTDLFAALQAGSTLIHVGRGAQLVEADLLLALENGHLEQAILDVFHTEPLPKGHPFWTHPRITISPHVAAISRAGMGASLILENYRRAILGRPLRHEINRERGY